VADTAFRTGSIAGELISQVVEQAFSFLKAPPVRIASPDFPTPTSPFMAEDYYPGPQSIADAALNLMGITKEADGYQRMSAAFARKGPHDAPNREFSGPF
jgi:acetoin:2,6-dichlorophenolindophenol oxidoreductase subunit beta